MRKLLNLKLWALVAVVIVGMNSCVNDDNSTSNFYIQYPYMIQNEDGTYTPQMRLLGYDIASAYFAMGENRFTFQSLDQYIWELPKKSMYTSGLDTVPFGYYSVVVTNKNGDVEKLALTFYASAKKLGNVNMNRLEYDSENNKLQISLKTPVQNASYYYLMVKLPIVTAGGITTGETMWVPYIRLDLNETNDYSGSLSLDGLSEGTYYFAVAACYETTFRFGESIAAEIKPNKGSDEPTTGEDKQ